MLLRLFGKDEHATLRFSEYLELYTALSPSPNPLGVIAAAKSGKSGKSGKRGGRDLEKREEGEEEEGRGETYRLPKLQKKSSNE